nr:uncharacterized protein LOC108082512 [Drosophila kikkawai]
MQRFQIMTRGMLSLQHAAALMTQQQHLRNLSIQWPLALPQNQSQKPAGGGKPGINQKPRPSASAQKITLIQQNQAMSITTLEEAQKLAKRRELHLMRLGETDAKTGRAMFKLVTASEMLTDDTEKSSEKGKEKKSEKSLTIGARITEHDLASRLKNIVKWLGKRHEVRILIQGSASGSDESGVERILKAIEQAIREPQVVGKIVQKRTKGSYVKFSIMPMASQPVATATTQS